MSIQTDASRVSDATLPANHGYWEDPSVDANRLASPADLDRNPISAANDELAVTPQALRERQSAVEIAMTAPRLPPETPMRTPDVLMPVMARQLAWMPPLPET